MRAGSSREGVEELGGGDSYLTGDEGGGEAFAGVAEEVEVGLGVGLWVLRWEVSEKLGELEGGAYVAGYHGEESGLSGAYIRWFMRRERGDWGELLTVWALEDPAVAFMDRPSDVFEDLRKLYVNF